MVYYMRSFWVYVPVVYILLDIERNSWLDGSTGALSATFLRAIATFMTTVLSLTAIVKYHCDGNP